MNKQGVSTDFHHHGDIRGERRIRFPKEPMPLRSISMEKTLLQQQYTDGVVVGKWNKTESPLRVNIERPKEWKFTIPSSPNNRNVFENMVERTTELKTQTLQELREKRKDQDRGREIWLID